MRERPRTGFDWARLGFYAGVIWAETKHFRGGVTPPNEIDLEAAARFPSDGELDRRAFELHRTGSTYAEVGAALGVSGTRARQRAERYYHRHLARLEAERREKGAS